MAHPKADSGYRIGIVNPMTLVGNEIKTILRERAFPSAKVILLDASGQSAGALTEIDSQPTVVAPVSQEGLDDLDLVFFCGAAATNREWIERREQDRFIAIDLSQSMPAEKGKLAVAGVNLDDVGDEDDLIVSPHPVTVPLALILHQIEELSPIEMCTSSVVQPASELGQEAVEELAQQTLSVLNIQPVPKTVFDRQLAFNLYPAADANEQLIVSQLRSLIDRRTEIALLVTQGTIFHSHTFSLFVKTREPLERAAIVEALQRNDALVMQEGDQQFGTIDAAGKDEVLIGEVREDPAIRGGFWVWAVCDNLRRSSALNAVLAAEKALFGGHVAN